jgi:hypothetical protein
MMAVLLFSMGVVKAVPNMISIRGTVAPQMLPYSLTSQWPTWTYLTDTDVLERVEDDLKEGWVQPTSYDKLFLPSDLPPPIAVPALGVVIANGVPRYVMPSVVLSLTTPERQWRNRGLNSLPRAYAWIDLFAPQVPRLDMLRLSAFGQSVADVRFLVSR